MEALHVAAPVYLPDEFNTFHGPEYNVIIPWLIPIIHAEAHYVFDYGWRAFEDGLMVILPIKPREHGLIDADRTRSSHDYYVVDCGRRRQRP
jgi:hypothetical protein